jgi:hypothetical protein
MDELYVLRNGSMSVDDELRRIHAHLNNQFLPQEDVLLLTRRATQLLIECRLGVEGTLEEGGQA